MIKKDSRLSYEFMHPACIDQVPPLRNSMSVYPPVVAQSVASSFVEVGVASTIASDACKHLPHT
jgi:hypothetical protein